MCGGMLLRGFIMTYFCGVRANPPSSCSVSSLVVVVVVVVVVFVFVCCCCCCAACHVCMNQWQEAG